MGLLDRLPGMGILRGLGRIGVYRVRGRSMGPRFFDGELLLVWGVGVEGGLRRGDVVVFRHPSVDGRLMLKRVAALPGERVGVVGGRVFVEGGATLEAGGGVGKGRRGVVGGGVGIGRGSSGSCWGITLSRAWTVVGWGLFGGRGFRGRVWFRYWPLLRGKEWWVMGEGRLRGPLVCGRRRFIRFGGIRFFLWWKRRVDLGKARRWNFSWGNGIRDGGVSAMGGWQWGCGRQGGDGSLHTRGHGEGGGSRVAPTRESPNTMKTGNHKGCPYGGRVRWRMGEGRFETCPYGEGVGCRGCGKDGFSPPSSRGQAFRGENG